MRTRHAAACLALAFSACTASAADAASTTTIGSLPGSFVGLVTGQPTLQVGSYQCGMARLEHEDERLPSYVVPPTSGYGAGQWHITAWRTYGATSPQRSSLVVVRPPAGGTLRSDPTAIAISDEVTVAASQVTTTEVDIPVEPGDEIGVRSTGACTFTSEYGGDEIDLYRTFDVGDTLVKPGPGFYANRPDVDATLEYRPTSAQPRGELVRPRRSARGRHLARRHGRQ